MPISVPTFEEAQAMFDALHACQKTSEDRLSEIEARVQALQEKADYAELLMLQFCLRAFMLRHVPVWAWYSRVTGLRFTIMLVDADGNIIETSEPLGGWT
jgi:hypothetical protein